MLVNIHLDELDLAARRLDRFFKNWRKLLAGFAPGCPKIDQDRLTRRFSDDIGAEARRGGIFYEQRRRSFRLSLAASLPAFLTRPRPNNPPCPGTPSRALMRANRRNFPDTPPPKCVFGGEIATVLCVLPLRFGCGLSFPRSPLTLQGRSCEVRVGSAFPGLIDLKGSCPWPRSWAWPHGAHLRCRFRDRYPTAIAAPR